MSQETAGSGFWALVDETERLKSELNGLTRRGGHLRGFSLGGFDSPARQRARTLAAQLETATARFKRAQADYINQMRENARGLIAESQTMSASPGAPRAARGGAFAALREATRASVAQHSVMVDEFEKAKAKFGSRR